MGAGAVVVVEEVVVEDAIALVLSIEALSFFAHPARTAAQQQIAMRVVRCSVNINPPDSSDGRPSFGAVPSQTNVRPARA